MVVNPTGVAAFAEDTPPSAKKSQGTILLNAFEITLLSDKIKSIDYGTEEMRVTSYLLLLKLGSVYVTLIDQDGNVGSESITLVLTEAEAWLLRDKIVTYDKGGNDAKMGIKLLRKLYILLLSLNQGDLDGILTAEGVEFQRKEVTEKLSTWTSTDDTTSRE